MNAAGPVVATSLIRKRAGPTEALEDKDAIAASALV